MMTAQTHKFRRAGAARFRLAGLALVLALGCAPASAQVVIRRPDRPERAVARAQEAVRARILGERGGRDEYVTFNGDAQRYAVSNAQAGVRGTGNYYRDGRGGRERREGFTYDVVYNTRDGRVVSAEYRFDDRGGDREVPRWLVGTFRGRNPSHRQQRTLVTVEPDGRVLAVHGDGTRERGTYINRQMRVGTWVWHVTRNADGFRAQDDATRRAEDFVRVERGDDETGDGRVPRWAVGIFRGTTDAGETELTIQRDGTAALTLLRSRDTFRGRFADGVLTFARGSFDVTREPDGLRTVQINNRRNQTSYRRVN